jgi:hypothetical protein
MAGRDLFANDPPAQGRDLLADESVGAPPAPPGPPHMNPAPVQREPLTADGFSQMVEQRKDEPFRLRMDEPIRPSWSNFLDLAVSAKGLLGAGEIAATAGTGFMASVAGGVAGTVQTLNPLADEGAGAQAVSAIKDLAYKPGQAGTDLVRSFTTAAGPYVPGLAKDAYSAAKASPDAVARDYGPFAGAIAKTLPEAIMQSFPAASALRKAGAVRPRQDLPLIPARGTPTTDQVQTVAKAAEEGNARLAPHVMPDQDIVRAADDLDVTLNPSHYSTNRSYVDFEQGLKSRPDSGLARVEEKAISDLGDRADDLITRLGGQTDKSVLDVRVGSEMTETITRLEEASDRIYKTVNERIPPSAQTATTSSAELLAKEISDLGGNTSLLTSAEKKVMSMARVADPATPDAPVGVPTTYAALDRVRKDIGSAIGKKSGPFKDDDVGKLKQLYQALTKDQERMADLHGVGETYRQAKQLITQRKGIEDAAVSLFGKEVSGSLVPKLKQAASALTAGDVSKFRTLINAVPEGLRTEAVATMLNDVFMAGARNKGSMGAGFRNAYEALNRNAGAKAEIFRHLPAHALERFDKIGKVAVGLYKAKALENTSRSARDVIAAMDDGGLFSRLYEGGKTVAKAEGVSSTVGAPGMGTAVAVGGLLAKKSTPSTQAADALITSPAFRVSIELHAKGLSPDKVLNASKQFKAWLTAQPPQIQKEVAAMGFVQYLTSGGETETETQQQSR